MRLFFITCALLVLGSEIVLAQNGFKWPEDEATAKEKVALYTDALKGKQYSDAVEPLQWLLDNAPDLNASIYINGIKIYEALEKAETDPSKKAEYQVKALKLYDDRIKYFNDEINVLNRKAFAAYKFYKKDKSKYQELYDLFKSTVEKSGAQLNTNLLVAYMDVVRRYNAATKSLTDEQVLEEYDAVSNIIDEKLKAGKDEAKVQKQKEMVDKLLTSMVKVDCDFIENKLGPKLIEKPDDLGMAKKIMGLSLAGNCSQLPIFLEAAKIVQKETPDFGIAKVIGIRSAANGDFETAIEYFNQAVDLAPDNAKKADVYYEMAIQFSKKGQKSNSRKYALQAVGADPSMSKAYTVIGNLYMGSFDDCKQLKSKVDDRAIYLAAYDMYQKAGNAKGMKAAEAQFPSISEMFELDLKEGGSITVGCWINVTTTLRRRPE
ncbi:MAG: hypothetical protein AAGF85_05585 [Bacteroidota bacterium]